MNIINKRKRILAPLIKKAKSALKQETATYVMGRLAREMRKKGLIAFDATMGDIYVRAKELKYLQKKGLLLPSERKCLFLFTQEAIPKTRRKADMIAKNNNINPTRYYMDFTGISPLKKAWSKLLREIYGVSFKQDEIICTNGGMAALSLAIKALKTYFFQVKRKRDIEVACPQVDWDSHWAQAEQLFLPVRKILVKEEDDFRMQADSLEKTLKKHPKIKILYFTNPVNPTGTLYTKREVEDLLTVIEKNNLFVIADEVYALTIFSGLKDFYGLISKTQKKENIFTIQSLTKSHASPGRRGGCLVVKNKRLKEVVSILKEKNELGLNVYGMLECAALMKLATLEHTRALRKLFALRTQLAYNSIMRINKLYYKKNKKSFLEKIIEPTHSFYLCLKLAKGLSVVDFLYKTNIVGVPSSGFGLTDQWLRLAFGCIPYFEIERMLKESKKIILS